MGTTTVKPFVFDKDYDNQEQVRPFMADFLAVKAEMNGRGEYPYNDSFKGKIPGLATTDSKNEDTAIYLLQTLARVDEMRDNISAAYVDGARLLTEGMPDETKRGTLYRFGWYMGGYGWQVIERCQVKIDGARVLFRLPRQKNWRTHHEGPGAYMFKPA